MKNNVFDLAVVNEIKVFFGEDLEQIKAYGDTLYISLERENVTYTFCLCDKGNYLKSYREHYDLFLSEVKETLKKQHNQKLLNEKLVELSPGRLPLVYSQLRELLVFAKNNGINIGYMYGLVSCLDKFKVTEKSIIAYDTFDNKVIFNGRSNKAFTFEKEGFIVL